MYCRGRAVLVAKLPWKVVNSPLLGLRKRVCMQGSGGQRGQAGWLHMQEGGDRWKGGGRLGPQG